MADAVFGDHQLKIPYEPVADLLAKYAGAIRTRPPSSISNPAPRSRSARLSAPPSTSRPT